MAEVDLHQIAHHVSEVTGLDEARALRLASDFDEFFARPFAQKLLGKNMKDIIKTKNPYLYRSSGIQTCEQLVRRALQDYVSASVEGYFGPFFEAVARLLSGGVKPALGGEVDLDIREEGTAFIYAIKSGPKGFNSSSYNKAKRDLGSVETRLRQDHIRTEKKIAFAYGRKRTTFRESIEHLASKSFWAGLSGDDNFYQKLLEACGFLAPLYTADMEAPYTRLLEEAHSLFCDGDSIDWGRVIRLVSG